jgi:hypothetical protein
MELGGAPERLPGSDVGGPLTGVVDQEHGGGEGPLQVTQVREQGRDLGDGVLVDAVESHEGVEDEQPGTEGGDRLLQAVAVLGQVEAETGRGDHVEVEAGEGHPGGLRDPLQPPAHDGQRLLGGEEEHGAGLGRREAAQAGRAGGDRDGQVEGQERLAAFGLAADDAHGLIGPELFDEPAGRLGTDPQVLDPADGERTHRRAAAGRGAGAFAGRGAAKSSR